MEYQLRDLLNEMRESDWSSDVCSSDLKLHCSVLAEESIKSAVKDYYCLLYTSRCV